MNNVNPTAHRQDRQDDRLVIEIKPLNQHFFSAQVTVPASLVTSLYEEASRTQQGRTFTHGFARGSTPLRYIESAYRSHIINHLKEFMYISLVQNFLYQALNEQQQVFAGEPRITDIVIAPGQDAIFTFELALPEQLNLRGWKYYPFKPPKRKNYRDLDRQVEFFLEEEEAIAQQHNDHAIQINDWVCLTIGIVNVHQQLVLPNHEQTLWIKIGNEEVDLPFQELLLGKKIDDLFYSDAPCLQEYFSSNTETHYLFAITIKDIVADAIFSLNDFKTKFKLRTNKEIRKKLIEVFSYRNDLSQRRETVEEVFKLLLAQHPFQAPAYLVLRHQHELIKHVQENPDYQVYRVQKDFDKKVHLLAQKQVKEAIIIDQLAHKENITASHHDIKQYLNLIKRPRTKEFIYFELPHTKRNGQELPIPAELLKRYCLREKTLNYVIYHLTRK